MGELPQCAQSARWDAPCVAHRALEGLLLPCTPCPESVCTRWRKMRAGPERDWTVMHWHFSGREGNPGLYCCTHFTEGDTEAQHLCAACAVQQACHAGLEAARGCGDAHTCCTRLAERGPKPTLPRDPAADPRAGGVGPRPYNGREAGASVCSCLDVSAAGKAGQICTL